MGVFIRLYKTQKMCSHIEKDTDRDRFMTPDEARMYGIIDKIITK
jgi:ATP-dependent protease ClpP protease subunit